MKQRAIAVGVYMGMTYREMVEYLGVSMGTIRRTTKLLQEGFAGWLD